MTVDKRYIFATLLCLIYYISMAVLSIYYSYSIDYFDYFPILLYCLMLKLSRRFFETIYGNIFGYYFNWKLLLVACASCSYTVIRAGLDFHFSPLIAFGVLFLLRVIAGALLWRRRCAHETQNNS